MNIMFLSNIIIIRDHKIYKKADICTYFTVYFLLIQYTRTIIMTRRGVTLNYVVIKLLKLFNPFQIIKKKISTKF